jgi:hypothetical protein
LKAILVAALTADLVWLLLPLMTFCTACPFALIRRCRNQLQTREQTVRVHRERQASDQQRHRREEQQRAEANSPERLRERQAAEERRRTEEEQLRRDRKRRENVRFEIRLLYDRYCAELQDKLPEEKLQTLLAEFLSDQHPPDEVETRGEALQIMLKDRLGLQDTASQTRFQSLNEIAIFYGRQRDALNDLGYDPETLDSLHKSLNKQEDAAIRQFLTP